LVKVIAHVCLLYKFSPLFAKVIHMNREEIVARVRARTEPWDLIVIGGGATGVGGAVDAASRGFDVLLIERSDFGKGTSSRSTKLVHGGVRYLAQGNLPLVREALKERGILRQNAPHLVHNTALVVPTYSLWQKFYYGAGLKVYGLLSGKYGFGKSQILSREETLERLPNVRAEGLTGGVMYFDGQFDDTRLLINLVTTAYEQGAALLNYARVFSLEKDENGRVMGVNFQDALDGTVLEARARVIINATGAFCDNVRKMSDASAKNIVTPSQGIHLVFDRSFLPGDSALMIPKTSDGRVLFAIPWHGHVVVGTTDTPIESVEEEPRALEEEINFVLETAGNYLEKKPRREDILSIFTGIRPLVKSGDAKNTAALSRGHTIEIDGAGLLTITGGKWTTYRSMAEDAVNQALKLGGLEERKSETERLHVHGYSRESNVYGADTKIIEEIINEDPGLAEKLHPDLPYSAAEIVFAVRYEMAQTLEDALARRTRALFLNARAAIEMAPAAAKIMAHELSKDKEWTAKQIEEFTQLAAGYLP
jgi:glycerol-3-phosphate dehydrogenase